jgi:hypothetical protein
LSVSTQRAQTYATIYIAMFDGNKLVDKVRLNEGNAGLNLEQNSLGVMLTQAASDVFQPGGPGTIIPLHLPLHIS